MARAQEDDGDDVQLQAVVQVFRNSSDHLRIVRIADSDGSIETLQTTDEHPFWVVRTGWDQWGNMQQWRGWVAARDLRGGDRLNEADDSNNAVVLSTVRQEHPERIAVYNFEVAGDHTYFVEDGQGRQTAVWVHNTCGGQNHWFPRAIGNNLPYGDPALTYLTKSQHTGFHRALNKFLRKVEMPDGRVLDMLARKGRRSDAIVRTIHINDRTLALDMFFRKYQGGARYNAFLDEMSAALSRGALK